MVSRSAWYSEDEHVDVNITAESNDEQPNANGRQAIPEKYRHTTNSMKLSTTREATSCVATRELRSTLW
jgi:hypothetical protein